MTVSLKVPVDPEGLSREAWRLHFFARVLMRLSNSPLGHTTLMRGRAVCAPIVPLLLTLVLSLNGIGPCLCTGESIENAADPHACCEHAKTEDAGRPTADTIVKPCALACAGNHGVLALAVPPNGAAQPNAVPLADTPRTVSPLGHGAPAALLAFDASRRHSPPLRTTVLRI